MISHIKDMAVPADFTLRDRLLKYRRFYVIAYHAAAVVVSNLLAFNLRFDGDIPDKYEFLLGFTIPFILVVRMTLFHFFGLYKGLWRYSGITDLQKILVSVTLGSLVLWVSLNLTLGFQGYPRSVYILDWLIVTALIGGVRLGIRSYKDYVSVKRKEGKKILVIGAGNAGEMIVRDMKNNPFYLYDPVGFIDDDIRKKGLTIHGVPIVGTRQDMDRAIKEYSPEELLIAIPSAKPSVLQELIAGLTGYKLPIKTVPNLSDILDGKISVNQIRSLELHDLLARSQVEADTESLHQLIRGKKVLVTGAGGTIGSEICRQVADWEAGAIIAYERHENSMYELDKDFRRNRPNAPFHPVVGDINDMQRVEDTLQSFRPDIIFHAAAHKHVPMMEINPREAIKNNIVGTKRLAALAEACGVGMFVLISTDKAVNPTNIMGASKRACELLVTSLDSGSKTRFIAVRFGNVLGSSGSVIPLFQEQIKRGGPVTITHPEMTRFLMLIPEAVQLVLQAAAIGGGGEIFVLDMGEPIKIVDLARNLIMLSGLEADKDIKLEFIGLRPGEKLYEELFDKSEEVAHTTAEKVSRAVSADLPDRDAALAFGEEIERLLVKRDTPGMIKLLSGFVKTYEAQPLL